MSNENENKRTGKRNVILSFILVGVIIFAGYFVLNKNNGASNLALNNEAMVARNDLQNPASHNLPNPLYLKEGFTDSSNSSLNENLNNENSLKNSKLKNENSPGAFAPGDPLVRGGFKISGGGSSGGGGSVTAGTGTEFSDLTTGTRNYSVNIAAGSNIVLFVSAGASSGSVTAVTYNSVPLNQLWSQSDGAGAQTSGAWILANPSTGTNTLSVTWSGGVLAGFAQPWYGVAQGGTQGTTWRAPTFGNDGGGGSATASQTSSNAQNGDMVLDVVAVYDQNPTENGSQTKQDEQNGPFGTTLNFGTSNKTATGATTMSWTQTSTYWAMGVVPLIPASVSGTSGNVKFR